MTASSTSASNEPDNSGFSEYFAILRKRRRLLLLVALPIVVLGGVLAVTLPDVYRSAGQIEIEGAQNVRNNPNALGQDPDESPYADQYVRSLSTVVLGDRNLARLLREHQLYEDQADDPAGALEKLNDDI